MSKAKIKLTDEQKQWAENLQWYVKNKICWLGPLEESYFKEMAIDGKYAVFSMNGETLWDHFDTVVCTDTIEGAEAIEKWNPSSLCRIVNLQTLWTQREVRRLYAPHFDVLVEKWEYDLQMKRYKELKQSLKPILKYFK